MKNHNYTSEIVMANQFVIDHNKDYKFMGVLRELKEGNYSHSEKWSILYDYCEENYPGATGTLITGLTYWLEQ